ncbi:hypothetical protein HK096_011102, partial [Nowakowskiella sp. JEL0078]
MQISRISPPPPNISQLSLLPPTPPKSPKHQNMYPMLSQSISTPTEPRLEWFDPPEESDEPNTPDYIALMGAAVYTYYNSVAGWIGDAVAGPLFAEMSSGVVEVLWEEVVDSGVGGLVEVVKLEKDTVETSITRCCGDRKVGVSALFGALRYSSDVMVGAW